MVDQVELIPGTALPIVAPGGTVQTEGRGEIELHPDRGPVSLLEKVADRFSPAELAYTQAALRAFDQQAKLERVVFDQATNTTENSANGNIAIQCYECPAGMEGRISFVTADTPGQSTITPTAPLANAATWCFIAILPASQGRGLPSNADLTNGALRMGLVDFWPDPPSSTGACLPAKFGTYGDDGGPVLYGGDSLWFCLIGGNQANIKGQTVKVNFRVNLWSRGGLPA